MALGAPSRLGGDRGGLTGPAGVDQGGDPSAHLQRSGNPREKTEVEQEGVTGMGVGWDVDVEQQEMVRMTNEV